MEGEFRSGEDLTRCSRRRSASLTRGMQRFYHSVLSIYKPMINTLVKKVASLSKEIEVAVEMMTGR